MPINRIAFYHLETLFWIARLGTFGAAADRLKTTQPAISARVRELEHHLGIKLFLKEGRTMTLTPAGRQLVRESEPLWASFQSVLLSCSDIAEATGTVRIGAGEIVAASCLPQFLTELQEKLPKVSLEVEIALTADLIQQIISGRSDLIFAAGKIAHPALRTRSIGSVDLIWLASPETARALEDEMLAREVPIWSLSSHSPLYQIMKNAIGQSSMTSRPVNLCNNVRSLIDIVMTGGGIGIFPYSMVHKQVESGALLPLANANAIPPVEFQAAIRAAESDPLMLHIFDLAGELDMQDRDAARL